MDLKEQFYDFLQKNFGNILSNFLSDLKIVLKARLTMKFIDKGIEIKFNPIKGNNIPFLVIVDKSKNKDIMKIELPLKGFIKLNGNIEMPIEFKLDLQKIT